MSFIIILFSSAVRHKRLSLTDKIRIAGVHRPKAILFSVDICYISLIRQQQCIPNSLLSHISYDAGFVVWRHLLSSWFDSLILRCQKCTEGLLNFHIAVNIVFFGLQSNVCDRKRLWLIKFSENERKFINYHFLWNMFTSFIKIPIQ